MRTIVETDSEDSKQPELPKGEGGPPPHTQKPEKSSPSPCPLEWLMGPGPDRVEEGEPRGLCLTFVIYILLLMLFPNVFVMS